MPRLKRKKEIIVEDTLSENWTKDKNIELVEVGLENKPVFFAILLVFAATLVLAGRMVFLSVFQSYRYEARAEDNQNLVNVMVAPRGTIYDRNGKVLAEDKPVFSAFLKTDEFLKNPDLQGKTLDAVEEILGIQPETILDFLKSGDLENEGKYFLLNQDLAQNEIVRLKGLNLPSIEIKSSFKRVYGDGQIFSSVIGYTGMVSASEIKSSPLLVQEDRIGKSGVELYYDSVLRGTNGKVVQKRDARGKLLGDKEETLPRIGNSLRLTIDADFQKYFYERMRAGFLSLGRVKGVGLAMNPENGEILALINFPVFDNNILSSAGRNNEKQAILNSPNKPLFDRSVSGFYNPGSTIKPLVAVAALKEGVITPEKEIFSPGYIDIPNPYDPEKPTRYLDWQYQGYVNLAYAIAQSSNVYFYEVGGGGPDSTGLGITRLREWWQKFNLGNLTGVDLPGEAEGFLPSPEWKEKREGKPWLLGDTYNVSIGQGNLLLTPIQLLSYISAIGNGGKIYRPALNKDAGIKVISDLSYLGPEIKEVRKGMRLVATSERSRVNMLGELPFAVEGKTGTAQIMSNEQSNAFFVGYTVPGNREESRVAVLVLVEDAVQGSLNAVPIAKDVFNWYYWNRIKK